MARSFQCGFSRQVSRRIFGTVCEISLHVDPVDSLTEIKNVAAI